jgi:hypothetical protein
MFSSFGNIFSSIKPRQTEAADTRLNIRHHDPEQQGKHGKKNERETPLPETMDNATVSVEALRLFLINFLRELEHEAGEHKTISAQTPDPAAPLRTEPDTAAARAASAYRASVIKTHDTAPPEIHERPLHASPNISAVHKLITDLSRLSATGIEELTIERGQTFLDSLITAVKNAQR